MKFIVLAFFLLWEYSFSTTFLIIDEETKEPLSNKSVIISQGEEVFDLTTNKKGEVSQDLKNGEVTVMLIDKNYNGFEKAITISPKQDTYNVSFAPRKKIIKSLNEVNSTSLSRTPLGGRKFDSKLLNDTIQSGGFSDIVYSLKKLPGVSFPPSYVSGLIFIQGGSGDDWIARFNGITIHDPLVWNRIISMFNPLYTESLMLYTTAMPSMYPNALSGAVDLTSKEYKNNWSGTLSFNITSIAAYAGGPISKKKDINMLVYARRSLLEIVIPKSNFNRQDSQYPNTWDAGLTFNYLPSSRLHIQQNNWMVISGLNTTSDERKELQDRYKNIPGYNPKDRNVNNQEYKGIHSIKFDYDLSSDVSLSASTAIIPSYSFIKISDDGAAKTDQKFLLLENQYNLESKIKVGDHILQPGITASYLYYESSINDYQTIISQKGTYTKTYSKNSKKENRGLFFPYLNADISLIGETLRMNVGGMISYSTVNQDVFFSPNIRLNYKTAEFNRIYVGFGAYNRTDQKLYSKLKSQKVAHSVLGTLFMFPKMLVSLEGFYKYFWDLPVLQQNAKFFSDVDRSFAYDSVGTKHAVGFGTGLSVLDAKRSVVSGDVSYTFQVAYRYDKKSSKRNFNGTTLTNDINPPEKQWYKDHQIREHAFGFELRFKPFVLLSVPNKYNSPSWYGAFHNYISTSFYVLSGGIGPSVRGIKQQGTIQTIEFDKYDGATTAPAYRLDLQWTFPIMGPDINIFLLIANATNYKSPLSKGYQIENGKVKDNDNLDFLGIIPFIGFSLTAPFAKENP